MMVTLVSQCEKKALNRTRRVLDAFANRIGDNTWQTVITQEGLEAVHKLLRKTASKSTAVSCHWLRSRSRSELLWIVGKAERFNFEGIVPVNITQKNLIHGDWENSWVHGRSIQIVAVIAALLHDIGKATYGFQNKLSGKRRNRFGDPYRHEWISLRLFEAMINGCSNDHEWLQRLANFSSFMKENPSWAEVLVNDANSENPLYRFHQLPALAQLVCWLIVTHHRLPLYHGINYFNRSVRLNERKARFHLECTIEDLYEELRPTDRWVYNQYSESKLSEVDKATFWQFKAIPMVSKKWQASMSRWANAALSHHPLLELTENPIGDPLILQLARMSLMVGDRNYSSLSIKDVRRVKGDSSMAGQLAANTDRESGQIKQALDEHLIGVGGFTAKFARLLPSLPRVLPMLKSKALSKRTGDRRFQWQNKAFDLAKKVQAISVGQGFFGINMASTGTGKTLGNARIMYGLADPEKGARFTIALGLRVLTLQTGKALRERMQLADDALAVLVGGSATQQLFELNQEEEQEDGLADLGSESLGELVHGEVRGGVCDSTEAVLSTLIADKKTQDLLYTPIVSCTVDHIINASESTRGTHIAPVLRLLTSDLILDEPDDFDQQDLPALARMVHVAGMLGSRVLLSSATLTPDLVAGLFAAYQAGRDCWNKHNGLAKAGIVCAWFDESKQQQRACANSLVFEREHQAFVAQRCRRLAGQPIRRSAEVLPVSPTAAGASTNVDYETLSAQISRAAIRLHHQHHESSAAMLKTASIGLVRLANIAPLMELTKAFYALKELPQDTEIHLCCYHARQLLLLRNALESKLDRLLNRNQGRTLFDHPEIEQAMASSIAEHHIFIVLASPVAEVGRDHDYDWAIVDPSSMRSIIQLAGRVWRHRPDRVSTTPNMMILGSNFRALKHGDNLGVGEPVFAWPGFESKGDFLLNSHLIADIISPQQLDAINSIARISRPEVPNNTSRLADLEHAVIADLLNNGELNYVNAYWRPATANRACAHLQLLSPFRHQDRKQREYVCLPHDDGSNGYGFMSATAAWENRSETDFVSHYIRHTPFDFKNSKVQPWLNFEFRPALEQLAAQLKEQDYHYVALRFATIQLEDHQQGWSFNPMLGFWAA